MYKINNFKEAREIYKSVMNHNLALDYPELEPYGGALATIFNVASLYKKTSNNKSTDLIVKVVDILQKVPIEKLNELDKSYLYPPSVYPLSPAVVYMTYLETLFFPKQSSGKNLKNYLISFSSIFRHAAYDLCRGRELPPFNHIDSIMRIAQPFYMLHPHQITIIEILLACYYANQDEFDISLIDMVLKDIDKYVERINFTFDKYEIQKVVNIEYEKTNEIILARMYWTLRDALRTLNNSNYKTIK